MRQTVKLIGYGVEGNFKIVDILYKKMAVYFIWLIGFL